MFQRGTITRQALNIFYTQNVTRKIKSPQPPSWKGASMDPSFTKRGWGDLEPLVQYAD